MGVSHYDAEANFFICVCFAKSNLGIIIVSVFTNLAKIGIWSNIFSRIVYGTHLSFPSHSNLCLSHPTGFPLLY